MEKEHKKKNSGRKTFLQKCIAAFQVYIFIFRKKIKGKQQKAAEFHLPSVLERLEQKMTYY